MLKVASSSGSANARGTLKLRSESRNASFGTSSWRRRQPCTMFARLPHPTSSTSNICQSKVRAKVTQHCTACAYFELAGAVEHRVTALVTVHMDESPIVRGAKRLVSSRLVCEPTGRRSRRKGQHKEACGGHYPALPRSVRPTSSDVSHIAKLILATLP